MPPIANTSVNGKPGEPPKSWKKINEERKAQKKQWKQEKQIKLLEKQKEAALLEEEKAKAKSEDSKEMRENPSTLSIAVPGSILENAQSAELRTYVAGQIARAASIFRVNEVIVFDDIGLATAKQTKRIDDDEDEEGENGASKTVRGSSLQLARILQYLECPQYLRKFFFPLHKDLKYSGLLNPLDTPHHLRQQSSFIYREGIISDKKAKEGCSYVNVGLLNDVLVYKAIEPGIRVTVKINNSSENKKKLRGSIVSPDEPRRETGVYWGYQVRIAHTISEIFTKSPYEGGYDLTIGTSDRGSNVQSLEQKSLNYKHMLIVFGGLKGLEGALAHDEQLNVDDPALLFDHYINVLPRQGSRTIRTEEALLIALAALQEKIVPATPDVEEDLSEFLPQSENTGNYPNPQQQFTKKKKKSNAFEMQTNNPPSEEEDQSLKRPMPSSSNGFEEVPSKLKKGKNNPFNSAQKTEKKSFDSPQLKKKNPFSTDKSDGSSSMDFSPSPKKFNESFVKTKTKNPFSPNKDLNPKPNEVSPLNMEDDFEVVPASLPNNQPSKTLADSDDLSRFD